jgi:hypothetical protein
MKNIIDADWFPALAVLAVVILAFFSIPPVIWLTSEWVSYWVVK